MNLSEAISLVEAKAEASQGTEKQEYSDLREWLKLLEGLVTCLGHGICHTWGMQDRECLERCYEMIEEAEEKLEVEEE